MRWKTGWLLLGLLLSLAAGARQITFELQAPQGVVTEKDYADKYMLLALGFTSCPDVCPTTLHDMAKTLQTLENPEAVQALFVSIDPVRDDVARLNAYTGYFDARITGLGGDMQHIRALADALGASFGYRLDGKRIEMPQADMPYTVYHSTLIYLLSPEGKLLDAVDYRMGSKGLQEALAKVGIHSLPTATNAQAASSADTRTDCPLPNGFAATDKKTALRDLMPQTSAKGAALLNLWALWCKPCREELPLLDALAGEQQGLEVHVLNLGDNPADIAQLFAELKLDTLAQTRTDDADILDRFGAVGLPFTALFVDGTLLAVKTGVLDDSASIAAFADCIHQP